MMKTTRLQKFREWLLSIASFKTLGLGLFLMLLFNIVIWPLSEKRIQQSAGMPVKVLDVTFFAPADTVRNYLGYYGEQGRADYLKIVLVADSIYPLSYAFFFCVALTLLYRRIGPKGYYVGAVASLPVFVALFDFLENSMVVSHLVLYPVMPQIMTWFLILFNTAKWLLLVATVVATLTGIILLLLKKK